MKWVNDILITLFNIIGSLIFSLLNFVYDIFCFLLDTIFKIVSFLLAPMFSVFDNISLAQYINMLPSEAVNILSIVGFGEATAMIAAALLVRFLLQLIPFVRLGS
ncbi:DUF2523 domain-containing protein [Photobacterium angustum]|uniref:DUF2523 family protein n=1 Tax=Photobacterium angustum TaxID=661 RepID=UPI00069A8A52|nr:DUF2523 family protein [Photobacterium angustum]PSW85947.1 DUF2523 domain-containing protein [Photobacterium angustum]